MDGGKVAVSKYSMSIAGIVQFRKTGRGADMNPQPSQAIEKAGFEPMTL